MIDLDIHDVESVTVAERPPRRNRSGRQFRVTLLRIASKSPAGEDQKITIRLFGGDAARVKILMGESHD